MTYKKVKKGLIIFSVILVLLIITSLIYLRTGNYNAKVLGKAHMVSDKNTTVIFKNGIEFIPSKPNGNGIILYQGAKVDISAYSVEAKILADNGYAIFIPKMPFNMAFFGINKANKIIENNPDIINWYMAGHSLGGSMAAKYKSKNQQNRGRKNEFFIDRSSKFSRIYKQSGYAKINFQWSKS